MNDATERWLPVVDFEGLYEVSDLGRVRSLDRTVVTKAGPRRYRGKILKPYVNTGTRGYPFVGLSRPGLDANYPVHRLVLEAFAGPCPPGQEARHGPAGKLDASLANLCYGTRAQNVGPDRVRDGQSNRGERQGLHKLTEAQVLEIARRRAAGEKLRPLADEFAVSIDTISGIALGKSWGWLNGERSPRRTSSKLTDGQVRQIRSRRAAGEDLQPLADEFAVSAQTISSICTGRSRNRLDGERTTRRRRKLTDDQVREIRQLRADGWRLEPLAARFNVTIPTISNVCSGKSWGHLDNS